MIWEGKASYPDEAKASSADRRHTRRMLRDAQRIASRFQGELDRGFQRLGSAVTVTVREPGKTLKADVVTPPAPSEMYDVTLEGGEVVYVEFPQDAVENEFHELYTSAWRLSVASGLDAVSERLGMGIGVNMDDPRARRLIETGGKRITAITSQTRTAITKGLEEGRVAGEGGDALARRIRGMIEGRDMYPGVYQRTYDARRANGWGHAAAERAGDQAARTYRAETIARTETKTAQNLSAIQGYKSSGVVAGILVFDGEGCGWTSHPDPDVANGSVRSFEDAAAQPLAHPRCVRSLAPQMVGQPMPGAETPEGEPQPGPETPGVASIAFTLAKTKAEVAERMGVFTDSYEFGDLSLEQQNSILRAAEETLGKHEVYLTRLGYQTRRQTSYGRCAHDMRNPTDQWVEIQKSYLRAAPQKAADQAIIFEKQKTAEVNRLRLAVADPARVLIREQNQKKLDHWLAVQRWSTFAEAADPVDAVVRHECYHALDHVFKLSDILVKELKKDGLPWEAVSEYGSTKGTELFAELATAVDSGIALPQPYIDVFRRVMTHAK